METLAQQQEASDTIGKDIEALTVISEQNSAAASQSANAALTSARSGAHTQQSIGAFRVLSVAPQNPLARCCVNLPYTHSVCGHPLGQGRFAEFAKSR